MRKLQYSSEQLIEDYERAREQGMTNDQVMEKLSNALDAFRKGEKVTQKNLWKHLDISPFDNSANG